MTEKLGFVISDGYEKLKDNLIDSIANPLFIKDSQHRWIMFNDSFCEIIDIPSHELLGKSDYDFFPKEEADVFWEKDDQVLLTGKTNINEEELTNKKGEILTILTSKVRIQDEVGNHFILGTITDVSDMKFDEIQLEKKNIKINAQKNEIKNAVIDLHFYAKQNLEIVNNIMDAILENFTSETNSDHFKELKNWIDSMLVVLKFFSESFNIKKVTLPYFIDQLVNKIPGMKDRLSLLISGDPVILSIRYMAPIGLIMLELLKASMDETKKNSVRIDIGQGGQELEIIFNSNCSLAPPQDAADPTSYIPPMLNSLSDFINGDIQWSPDNRMVKIHLKDIYASGQ